MIQKSRSADQAKFKRFARKKFCRFCAEKTPFIDYKDMRTLRSYVTERGKILPSRMTGTCAGHQRELTTAVKRARNIAMLSFMEK
ncbi:MAG: 30S ribosomal protein S18 [Nitrospirae bacterium]|uniref:30S ribosomal protein S18 n=1 Tax=Candidatus Magnetomonas plexicatena TaxID=2552947 RepID=UPI0019E94CDA|nr:30S ribosomal protein S18 [Nitrospirota bacterium]MBF0519988.1 30S ribosomal protein S18 [Nitrospirota bacterium]MBF0536405.1 30S ribosomal protein S18 [Nitrospirota bacterium]MBF0618327.1 30S ribosomal protein S18 [Nitrospirota bacterium]QWR76202.1 30S ribosomal protein S18 [Nitrospirales bacterium LBB_01]